MSTEYHQLPSQQGFLPAELLTETDPWLLAATNNLSLNESWGSSANVISVNPSSNNMRDNMMGGTPKLTNKPPRSPLFEHAGHNDANRTNHSNGNSLGVNNIENAWKSVSTPLTDISSPLKMSVPYITASLPNTPKEYYSNASKIDAWSVQSPSSLLDPMRKKNHKSQLTQSQLMMQPASPLMLDDEEDNDDLAQNRYKTELCKSFTETGNCRYGTKCQFAHGKEEVRGLLRHPKYKTETCKTFHSTGTCPYGTRCRFIHTRAKEEALVSSGSYEEQFLGNMTPPPGLSAQQWSKSWSPSSNLQQQQKKSANKKHGLGKIPLMEAMPDF